MNENKIYSIIWNYKGEIEGQQIRSALNAEQAVTSFQREMRSVLLQHTAGQEVDLLHLNVRIDQVFEGVSRSVIIRALRSASNDDLIKILKEVFQ